MDKIIFLDIDGVLNSEALCKRKPYPQCHGIFGIDKNAVKLLKQIVDATNAKIVLVSSWKKSFDAFKRRGYKAAKYEDFLYTEELESCGILGKYLSNKLYDQKLKVADTTTRYEGNSCRRGTGILKYLEENPADGYVILDDEQFQDYQGRPAILDHLIQTDYKVGLTEQDVKKAIEILNKE